MTKGLHTHTGVWASYPLCFKFDCVSTNCDLKFAAIIGSERQRIREGAESLDDRTHFL